MKLYSFHVRTKPFMFADIIVASSSAASHVSLLTYHRQHNVLNRLLISTCFDSKGIPVLHKKNWDLLPAGKAFAHIQGQRTSSLTRKPDNIISSLSFGLFSHLLLYIHLSSQNVFQGGVLEPSRPYLRSSSNYNPFSTLILWRNSALIGKFDWKKSSLGTISLDQRRSTGKGYFLNTRIFIKRSSQPES